MKVPTSFRLKIQQLNRSCLFELSWGRGQQLCTQLNYPEKLSSLYCQWQKAYLNYYKHYQVNNQTVHPSAPAAENSKLRGRLQGSGRLTPVDRHAQLVQAEAELLSEFERWLRSAELYDIRAIIARAARANSPDSHLEIFLSCAPLELERLPWEAWAIGEDLGYGGTIRLVRAPVNIRRETPQISRQFCHHRARILAILGDDTGLNFAREKKALRSLSSIADIKFVGWQRGKQRAELIKQIRQAIADEQGWDILFFAGHSNETNLTGGQLAIAPRLSISVSEIATQLQQAKARGLQFAVFNSCNGLSIASSLIDLGLSQVAVMREPIHNQVAQVFLVQFLRQLAECKDVHDALLAACQFLKQQNNLDYPSAYLIPSLFRHPEGRLFRFQSCGWRASVQRWLPNRREAIALGFSILLGFIPPVQQFLLQGRVLVQGIYRDLTSQIPSEARPPVLLIQIDEQSLRQAGISDPHPLDRRYLANLIEQLVARDVKIIGIDYLLDRQQPEKDPILARAVHSGVANKGIWFVFAAQLDRNGQEVGVATETDITSPNWSLQGYTNALPEYVKIPSPETDCSQACPFAYLLSVVYALNQESSTTKMLQPQLSDRRDYRTQLFDYLHQQEHHNDTVNFLRQVKLHPLTNFAANFGWHWLRPINDFSLPPEQVYNHLAAWQLLDNTAANSLPDYWWEQQIVIIAPGGYEEAGVKPGADNFPIPWAVKYWRERYGTAPISLDNFTGSEFLAYMIYQLLNQRLVVNVPELWIIAIAGLIGKGITLGLNWHSCQLSKWSLGLASCTVAYVLVALQIYLSAAVLLPIFLPSAAFWIYVMPTLRRKSHETD